MRELTLEYIKEYVDTVYPPTTSMLLRDRQINELMRNVAFATLYDAMDFLNGVVEEVEFTDEP